MSYDLYFVGPAPRNPAAAFTEYFSARARYTVDGGQAIYENQDTGVYFTFDLTSNDEDDPEESEGVPDAWASFNLNYYRPHFFGTEATLELEAFVERFGRQVHDPQAEGMGEDPFSVEGFLRGWAHGNDFARRAVENDSSPPERPKELLARIWRWNFERAAVQARLGDDIFVPRISFYEIEGRICTASIWTDAIPTLLPQTDAVVIYRQELAPRRLLRKQPGTAVAEWSAVVAHLGECRQGTDPLLHFYTAARPSADLTQWITSLPPHTDIKGVSMDLVLDQAKAPPED